MKKNRLLKTFLVAMLMAAALPAFPQGEWKWANYWTGNDGSGSTFNHVVSTAIDDDGNVYVFGNFGGNAQIYDQNQSSYFCNIASIISANTPGTALIKFDSNGNTLWKKVIKSNYDLSNMPYDMCLKDGRITIAGEYSWNLGINKQVWFVDTLITQQVATAYSSNEHNPPFTFGTYTYFISFDLDGNKLESHFVKVKSRELYQGQQVDFPIGRRVIGNYPLCIDNYGNTYLAVSTQYGGVESSPFTVVIDEDSSKTYNLSLPGNCNSSLYLSNIMVYKFSPTWELMWMKLVVNHTEGLSPALPYDSINPEFRPYVGGLNVDENSNLYLSGYIADIFMYDEYNQYPMYIYWDSTHRATINDHGLSHYLPFIIKYDANGNIEWANQAFVRNPDNYSFFNKTIWTDHCVKGQYVYISGYADLLDGLSAEYSFGEESNIVPISQYSSYFVRFNKSDGTFESCGIVPGDKNGLDIGESSLPAVTNNHLLGMCRNYFSSYYLLNYFNVDGHFDYADTIWYTSKNHSARLGVAVNENGKIICNMIANQDLTFGNDLTLNFDDHLHSHAVVAFRYDPSILEPYPEDPIGLVSHNETPVVIYPNPATNTLYVEMNDDIIKCVTILDMSGKELFRQKIFENKGIINVAFLSRGMYYLKTIGEKGTLNLGKFIKF
jgi:hypothetical protein